MLTVQIGQCGNQLGHTFFQKLAEEQPISPHRQHGHESACEDMFFRTTSLSSSRCARAVLIDMEPKVVQRLTHTPSLQSQAWGYDPTNCFIKQSGSGNNWAYGYAVHGTQHEQDIMDLLQAEAERCDLLKGFLVLQSVAGGTGSGLGSFLTERIADFYPHALLLNTAVWPYQSGEVIVQNYNALLTLSSISTIADGVLVLQNDVASEVCKRLLRVPRPSFDELNNVMATQMASAFLPVTENAASNRVIDPISEMCQHLCAHPGYKLLNIKMIPQMPHRSKAFSTHTWSGILKHLHQMQITNSPFEEGIDWHVRLENANRCKAIGNLLMVRGQNVYDVDATAFRDSRMYAAWSVQPFEYYSSTRPFNSYDKTATLISNSQAIVPILASFVDKAYDMFAHTAYLHQYAQHGVDYGFFQQAFLQTDQILRNYQLLA